MKRFTSFKPLTYFSSVPVKILDQKGNLFYGHPNKEGSILFNLPVGTFRSVNEISDTGYFKPYPVAPLPYVDYSIIPKDYLLRSTKNKNKATIIPGVDFFYSFIDPSIANHIYKPCLYFVLGHEIHHYFFHDKTEESENLCDVGSYNLMMRNGFNPLQVEIAQRLLFDSPTRSECISKCIKQNSIRR